MECIDGMVKFSYSIAMGGVVVLYWVGLVCLQMGRKGGFCGGCDFDLLLL